MSRNHVLRALLLASLAAGAFHTHVYVAFRPVRVKVVQSPVAASGGIVRVSTAGFPRVQDIGTPFALIARVKAPASGASRLAVALDGRPVCEKDVAAGSARRLDCVVNVEWNGSIDHEVTFQGPATAWTLDYLELATHHGNATGVMTLFIVPPNSRAFDQPAAGWSLLVWAALAALLLFVPPHPLTRLTRPIFRVASVVVVALLAVSLCSQWVSDYLIVLATGTYLLWLAILLSPRLWTAARQLRAAAGRLEQSIRTRGAALASPFFDRHPAWRPRAGWARAAWPWVALALVVGVFCAPLFVNLSEPDVWSDEAIYSYAVDRILDTGNWLTPRSVVTDFAFLEKPPLKFWLIAGGMRAGLLPSDDRGMRLLDALFGAVAFLYVYAMGRRLSGPLAGVIAVLVLFTLDPLVFEHGLRTNNMEAALFLGYCGGVYHFARWAEAAPKRAPGHAAAVCAYFFLGFMTKFVAALFLPVVCVAALVARRDSWAIVRSGWRDWVVPVLATSALTAPWFIYQSIKLPEQFWQIILGQHVYERFTSSLDPAHIQPWYYYAVQTWKELERAGSNWLVLAGFAGLVAAAVRRNGWGPRLVLLWGVLPLAAISLVTSKLVHYAYPFWPPFALGAGLFAGSMLRASEGSIGDGAAARLRRLVPAAVVRWCAANAGRRRLLAGAAVAAVVVAAWTAVRGSFAVTLGGATYFSNTSVLAPLGAAGLLLLAGGRWKWVVRLAVASALVAALPLAAYPERIEHVMKISHPVRATRDCMESLKRSGAKTGSGVLVVRRDIEYRQKYYYYLWRTGDWTVNPDLSVEQAVARLSVDGAQTPVLISRADFETLVRHLGSAATPVGVTIEDDVAILLPGPFGACRADILAAGARPLWTVDGGSPRPER